MLNSNYKQKLFIISVSVFNIVLLFDYMILGILKRYIPVLRTLFVFWFQLDFLNPSFNDFTFFYIDLVVKLVLLLQLLYFIIRGKDNLYNQILIKCLLFVYGLSFIYQYIFWDFISFQVSVLIKYILISVSILLFHNYFRKLNIRSQFYWFLTKKASLILIFVFSMPFFIFETLHVIEAKRITNQLIINPIQALVNSQLSKDFSNEILLNQKSLFISRTVLCNNLKNIKLSLFDKLYMYSQINIDKIQFWDSIHISNTICIPYDDIDILQINSLSKTYKTPYVYCYSKPIFNFNNDLAYIFVFRIFIPELTGRYFGSETVFLEKKNNIWKIKK